MPSSAPSTPSGPSRTGRCTASARTWARPPMSRRWSSATWGPTAQPASPSRAIPNTGAPGSSASTCRTRRARTSWPACARRDRSARWQRSGLPEAGAAAAGDRRPARSPLHRHAGPRVHGRAGQALDAADPDRQADRPGGGADRGRYGAKPGRSIDRRRSAGSAPAQARAADAPASRPDAPHESCSRPACRPAPARRPARSSSTTAEAKRRGEAGEAVMLVRTETAADDFPGMRRAAGDPDRARRHDVARGGRRAWHGHARGDRVRARSRSMSGPARSGRRPRSSRTGDDLTIDGATGQVILGKAPMIAPHLGDHATRCSLGGRAAAAQSPRQCRYAGRCAAGARARRRGHRALPHGAHVLRRRTASTSCAT